MIFIYTWNLSDCKTNICSRTQHPKIGAIYETLMKANKGVIQSHKDITYIR